MKVVPDFVPFALPDIGELEISAVVESLRSGWITTGPACAAFEKEFSAYLGGDGLHAVAVNSATAGLHLALEALGIGTGDEVLVPTWTFTSTAEVVQYVGATPIFVDVEPDTLNIDLDAAKRAITARTKAIIPVHFAGLAVDRLKLEEFSNEHGLRVVEDAAHAFPATSHGALVGQGTSSAVVFSFYATKTMTTGEGGMLVTRDAALAARARTMRLHGINRDVFDRYRSTRAAWRYDVIAPGFKYNLTDPAAAMGRVQLGRATSMRAARAAVAGRYDEALSSLPLDLPARSSGAGDSHAWHLYVVRLAPGAGLARDEVIGKLAERGVGTSVHFIPLHQQPYWRQRYELSDFLYPVASSQFERSFSLPLFSSLKEDQICKIIQEVTAVFAA